MIGYYDDPGVVVHIIFAHVFKKLSETEHGVHIHIIRTFLIIGTQIQTVTFIIIYTVIRMIHLSLCLSEYIVRLCQDKRIMSKLIIHEEEIIIFIIRNLYSFRDMAEHVRSVVSDIKFVTAYLIKIISVVISICTATGIILNILYLNISLYLINSALVSFAPSEKTFFPR